MKFLSSGLLYRYASYQLLKFEPKNKVFFLKKKFNKLKLSQLINKKFHSPEISEHTSIIAKQQKIRNVLKIFQIPTALATSLLLHFSLQLMNTIDLVTF